jgi:hypothetical protein
MIIEFEMKDTTDKVGSASFLDIPVEIDWGQVKNETMTRDDFNFRIANFQLQCMCSSTCIRSRYLSVDPLFQSLWFLS